LATGSVKWFNKNKGYGFITAEGERDIFVHFSSIKGKGYRVLEQGDEVLFDLVQTPKGPQAFNVKKANGSGEEAQEAQEDTGLTTH
jgi:CspA family cold shock protein